MYIYDTQAAYREIEISNIVRWGVFAKYTSRENLYAYGIYLCVGVYTRVQK